MNRIVKINLADILVDAKRVSEIINEACRHRQPAKVVGCCRTAKNLLVFLEPVETVGEEIYHVAPFPSRNESEVVAEVSSRYFAGFSTIGGFDVDDDGKWGLFAENPNLNSANDVQRQQRAD